MKIFFAGVLEGVIVPKLRVGTPRVTLCVTAWDAERPGCITTRSVGTIKPKAYP